MIGMIYAGILGILRFGEKGKKAFLWGLAAITIHALLVVYGYSYLKNRMAQTKNEHHIDK